MIWKRDSKNKSHDRYGSKRKARVKKQVNQVSSQN